MVKNPVFHAHTKHIDMRHHFIRDAQENGHIDVCFKPTEEMVADVFTKGLTSDKHHKCIQGLGLITDCEKFF